LHIAYFTNFYKPVVNGVVRSVSSFREALTELGHNVFIFAQADEDYKDEEPFIFRYPSLTLPMQTEVPAVIPVWPFVDLLLPPLQLDVIHTHHPILLGQAAVRKAEELDLPLVFTFHTQYREYTHYIPLPQDAIQKFLKEAVQTWLMDFMRKCQHIVIPSESMKEILLQDYGLQDRYTVIPTGIDLNPYRIANKKAVRNRRGWQDDKVLISIGRLAPEKNWDMLLKAAATVIHSHHDLRLVLIGDGPQKADLENLASTLGIAGQVTFMGQLLFTEVPIYLKSADIFGFTSLTETQGLVTMEAMAAGLPIVAVDASGTRDIVDHGKQGFLVPNDSDALAASIIQLLESHEMMQQFSFRAQEKAKSFEARRLSRKLIEVYEQSIEDKKGNKFVSVAED